MKAEVFMEIPFKVLLVDDQKLVLDGLIEQLHWERFHGILCGSAQNGLQALELLETIRPDVIRMPVLDGIRLARQLHESTQFSDIPIIFYPATGNLNMPKELCNIM